MKRILCCLAASIVFIAPACAETIGRSFDSGLDEIFAEYDSTHSPGCAVAVIRKGEIIHERAYGMADLEHDVPMTPRAVVHIASVSKQFTAAAIALLEEQGKLSPDDDVRKYVPELPDYGHKIAIQHLVHHTSGLRDYQNLISLSGRSISEAMPEEAIVDLLARQKQLNFAPGTQHSYNNSGYFLLALIVKRVSGQSLAEFAAENIFQPLGMTHTGFYNGDRHSTAYNDDTAALVPDRAMGYLKGNAGLGYRLVRTNFDSTGAAGLLTTLGDLARWEHHFYQNTLGEGGPALLERVLSVRPLNDGTPNNYAYGLILDRYRGLKVVMHSGGLGGFSAFLMRFPEQGFSVATLCNQGRIAVGGLTRKTADLYLANYLSMPAGDAKPAEDSAPLQLPSLPAPTAELMANYVGDYASDELDAVVRVRVVDGQLKVRVGYAPARSPKPLGKDHFLFDGVNQMLFKRDARGRVNGIEFKAERIRSLIVPRAAQRK